jgi:hypothetical protein
VEPRKEEEYENGRDKNAYKILVGKPNRRRLHGRPKRRWEDIRTDIREIGWEDV